MLYSKRFNNKSHDSYGGWSMSWERVVEGRLYKFTRAFMHGGVGWGNKPFVYFAAYRYDNKGTWVQTHAYQLAA